VKLDVNTAIGGMLMIDTESVRGAAGCVGDMQLGESGRENVEES